MRRMWATVLVVTFFTAPAMLLALNSRARRSRLLWAVGIWAELTP